LIEIAARHNDSDGGFQQFSDDRQMMLPGRYTFEKVISGRQSGLNIGVLIQINREMIRIDEMSPKRPDFATPEFVHRG
jgi:hypothetical protein